MTENTQTKERIKKSPKQLEVLNKFHKEGMTSYGKDNIKSLTLISDAMKETKLSESQIKNWIDSKRKKRNEKVKIYARNCRGYDLFRKDFMSSQQSKSDPAETLKHANAKWKEMNEEDKLVYKDQAKGIQKPIFNDMERSHQLKHITAIRKKIETLCNELDNCGVTSIVLDIDPERTGSDVSVYGSKKGVEFINDNDSIIHQYSAYNTPGCLPSLSLEKNADRKAMAEMMNKKIYEFSKGKWSRFPYSKVDDGTISVIGLPEFVKFKNPSACNKTELSLLKDHINQISFIINRNDSCSKELSKKKRSHENSKAEVVPKKTKEVSVSDKDCEMDDVCLTLSLDDFIPNSDITLKEVLDKAKVNEGFVDNILKHRNFGEEIEYEVKWVGFKNTTWEIPANIPGESISIYWNRINK